MHISLWVQFWNKILNTYSMYYFVLYILYICILYTNIFKKVKMFFMLFFMFLFSVPHFGKQNEFSCSDTKLQIYTSKNISPWKWCQTWYCRSVYVFRSHAALPELCCTSAFLLIRPWSCELCESIWLTGGRCLHSEHDSPGSVFSSPTWQRTWKA